MLQVSHKFVHFSCTYQSMQSYPIITPNLSLFLSPTTLVQHSSFPPQKAIWINLGPLFGTLARRSSDMYRIWHFAIPQNVSNTSVIIWIRTNPTGLWWEMRWLKRRKKNDDNETMNSVITPKDWLLASYSINFWLLPSPVRSLWISISTMSSPTQRITAARVN